MTSIEEYTERMDLLQKTAIVEAKQKKRIMELQAQKQKKMQEEKMLNLLSGGTNSSILEQEENQRKMLLDSMVKSATPSTTPIVRVLNNAQGILSLSSLWFLNAKITYVLNTFLYNSLLLIPYYNIFFSYWPFQIQISSFLSHVGEDAPKWWEHERYYSGQLYRHPGAEKWTEQTGIKNWYHQASRFAFHFRKGNGRAWFIWVFPCPQARTTFKLHGSYPPTMGSTEEWVL